MTCLLYTSGYADDAEGAAEIKARFDEDNYLCDTHTAVAFRVAEALRTEAPMVVPVSYTHLDVYKRQALNEVDKFLDSGMLRGQTTLYIIHGNGTGALRTAIQKHLRTHRCV